MDTLLDAYLALVSTGTEKGPLLCLPASTQGKLMGTGIRLLSYMNQWKI